jgi:hypothetical protein
MTEGSPALAPIAPELFSVECTTCKARLKVRSAAAIGQILGCPKCHSMVLVAAPADWHPAGEAPPVATDVANATSASAVAASTLGKTLTLGAAAATCCAAGVYFLWTQLPQRTPTPTPVVAQVVDTLPPVESELTEAPADDANEPPATDSVVAEEANAAATEEVPPTTNDASAESPSVAPIENPAPEVAGQPAPEPQVEIAAETEPVEIAPPEPVAEPAPEVDVAAASTADDLLRRLQTDLAAIDEPAISLAALAELLGGLAACSIELDDVSLASIGVTGESSTSVKLEDATIEAALIAALEPLGLAYEPRGKSIVIFAARN